MPVSFTADQKAAAKASGQPLIAISAGGLEYFGPTSEEERDALARYLLDFLERRRAMLKGKACPDPCMNGTTGPNIATATH